MIENIIFFLQFIAGPLFALVKNRSLKYMRSNMLFIFLKYQDVSIGSFLDIRKTCNVESVSIILITPCTTHIYPKRVRYVWLTFAIQKYLTLKLEKIQNCMISKVIYCLWQKWPVMKLAGKETLCIVETKSIHRSMVTYSNFI